MIKTFQSYAEMQQYLDFWGTAYISDTRYYFLHGSLVKVQLQFLRKVCDCGLWQNLGK